MQFWLSFFFIAATPFLGLWAFSDSLPFQDEISSYIAFCPDGRKDGKCKSEEQAFDKITYKPIAESQVVIYWRDGSLTRRYADCAVRNSKNWTCKVEGKSDPTLMMEGSYQDEFLLASDRFYQVPKWYWWWLKLNANTAPNPKQK
jgi:hypothetical protein